MSPAVLAVAALRRALGRRDGSVAVEFALVALPFLFMLFAIVEIGLIFVANFNLSNATLALARQLRTGALVAAGTGASSSGNTISLSGFKAAICSNIQIVSNATCLAQLQVDVRTQSAFGNGQSAPNPLTGTGFNTGSLCFYSGTAGSIVQFRAFFLWSVSTPLLLTALVNATSYTAGSTTTAGNYYVLVSSEVFKVEPNAATNAGSGC